MTLMPFNNFTSSQQRGKPKTKTNLELKQLAKGCAILIGMCFIYKAQSNLQAHSNVSCETAFGGHEDKQHHFQMANTKRPQGRALQATGASENVHLLFSLNLQTAEESWEQDPFKIMEGFTILVSWFQDRIRSERVIILTFTWLGILHRKVFEVKLEEIRLN